MSDLLERIKLYSVWIGKDNSQEIIDLIEQQQQRIAELEQCEQELAATVERLRGLFGDFENDPNDSRIGWNKKTLEVLRATPPQNLNAVKREVAATAIRVALRNLGNADLNESEINHFADDYINQLYPDKE